MFWGISVDDKVPLDLHHMKNWFSVGHWISYPSVSSWIWWHQLYLRKSCAESNGCVEREIHGNNILICIHIHSLQYMDNSRPGKLWEYTEYTIVKWGRISWNTSSKSGSVCLSIILILQLISTSSIQKVSGWWLTYPSEKDLSVGMMKFPIYGKIKIMFQTTNQVWIYPTFGSFNGCQRRCNETPGRQQAQAPEESEAAHHPYGPQGLQGLHETPDAGPVEAVGNAIDPYRSNISKRNKWMWIQRNI